MVEKLGTHKPMTDNSVLVAPQSWGAREASRRLHLHPLGDGHLERNAWQGRTCFGGSCIVVGAPIPHILMLIGQR